MSELQSLQKAYQLLINLGAAQSYSGQVLRDRIQQIKNQGVIK